MSARRKRNRYVSKERTVQFGVFSNVPEDLIVEVGFQCPICSRPVRRVGLATPELVPRMMYGCSVAVACWEDERQPRDSEHWSWNVELGKKHGAGMVMFNGNKPLPPEFQGRN
jgi:hypothetical protein